MILLENLVVRKQAHSAEAGILLKTLSWEKPWAAQPAVPGPNGPGEGQTTQRWLP